MRSHSRRNAALFWIVLTLAAAVAPARAELGKVIAVLADGTGTEIQITNVGTAPMIVCHGRLLICGEAFTFCVNNTFHAGASDADAINLTPMPFNSANPTSQNPFRLGIPFFQQRSSSGVKTTYLTPDPDETGPDGAPIYRLNEQDLDGDGAFDDAVPLGALVSVVVNTAPSSGCVGVQTTFQHQVGTCKLCKIRKLYNACRTRQTITQIKELELPCDPGVFAAKEGPGKYRTAVALTTNPDTGDTAYITFQSTGSTGANAGGASVPPYQRSAAGSVAISVFGDEFDNCRIVPFAQGFSDVESEYFTASRVTSTDVTEDDEPDPRWLELFLSFVPGGLTLQPVATAGSEKFVTFCVDVE
jgi:hypothetical protein